MKSVVAWGKAMGLLGLEVSLVVVLWLAGPIMGTVDFGNLHAWLAESTPQGAVTALLRLFGLIGATWVLAISLLWMVAGVAGLRGIQNRLGQLTFPVVRRLLQPVAGLSMLASVTMSSGVASAAPSPPSTHLLAGSPVTHSQKANAAEADLPEAVPVSTSAVGRHIPHPGVIEHNLPNTGFGSRTNSAALSANSFAGLKPGTKVYVVQAGDCLSMIAQKHLGDWRLDLVIDQLNRGRMQPDGRALADDHWIYPGWVLVMPAGATGVTVVGGSGVHPHHVERPRKVRAAPSPPHVVTHVRSPDWAEPGPPIAKKQLQEQPAQRHDPERQVPPPRRREVPEPERVPTQAERASRTGHNSDLAPIAAWTAGLSAVVAGGLLWKLDRIRRERSHGRPTGHVLAPTSPAVQAVERRLRAIGDREKASWVDAGLRYMTGLVESQVLEGASVPSLAFLEVGCEGLTFTLTGVVDQALGWCRMVADHKFLLDPEVDLGELEALAGDRWPAWPALVSLGDLESGPSLFVNLEHLGSLSVQGPEEGVTSFMSYLAVQLSSLPWTEEMIGGFYALGTIPQASGKARKLSDDDTMGLAEKLDGIAMSNQHVSGGVAISVLRAVASEALPQIVLAFPGTPPSAVTCIAEAAVPETSAVVLVSGEPCEDAAWQLLLDSGGNGVLQRKGDGRGTTFRLKVPNPGQEVALVSEALGAAAKTVPYSAAGPSSMTSETIDIRTEAATVGPGPDTKSIDEKIEDLDQDDEVRPGLVEIAVLGPVELKGGDLEAVERGRQIAPLSLIAYLATRERFVTADEIATTLWPLDASKESGNGPQRKTIMNVVSRARALLGYGQGGAERIIYSQRGYRLSPEVTSDWARFQRLLSQARQGTLVERVGTLKQALQLVRGEPFTGALSSQFFEWVASEHLDFTIAAQVVDAAQELGEMALEVGDFQTVQLAVEKGLSIEPTREELFRLWMHFFGRTGRPARVDDVYKRLKLVLRQRVHPLQEPQPESRAVWRQYTGVEFASNLFD